MDIRERIEEELGRTLDRLRRLDGAVALEAEIPVLAESPHFADPMDEVEYRKRRELRFATRSLLLERAGRLADARRRLHEGTYGTCEECGGAISAARVWAIPEVATCVRCQASLEHAQKVGAARAGFDERYEKSA